MAYTQAQLDALDAAIASSVLTVEFENRRVTYRSLAELQQARNLVSSALAAEAGTPRPRLIHAGASKGITL